MTPRKAPPSCVKRSASPLAQLNASELHSWSAGRWCQEGFFCSCNLGCTFQCLTCRAAAGSACSRRIQRHPTAARGTAARGTAAQWWQRMQPSWAPKQLNAGIANWLQASRLQPSCLPWLLQRDTKACMAHRPASESTFYPPFHAQQVSTASETGPVLGQPGCPSHRRRLATTTHYRLGWTDGASPIEGLVIKIRKWLLGRSRPLPTSSILLYWSTGGASHAPALAVPLGGCPAPLSWGGCCQSGAEACCQVHRELPAAMQHEKVGKVGRCCARPGGHQDGHCWWWRNVPAMPQQINHDARSE